MDQEEEWGHFYDASSEEEEDAALNDAWLLDLGLDADADAEALDAAASRTLDGRPLQPKTWKTIEQRLLALERCHATGYCAAVVDYDRRSFRAQIPYENEDACVASLGLDRREMCVPVLAYAANVLGLDLGRVPDLCSAGYGLLHWAAECAPVALTVWLVKHCNVNARTARNAMGATAGTTPLHLAASRGRLPVARALLEGGADWRVTDSPNFRYFRHTPLHFHARFGPTPPLQFAFRALVDASCPCWDISQLVDLFRENKADLAVVYRFGGGTGNLLDQATFERRDRLAQYLCSVGLRAAKDEAALRGDCPSPRPLTNERDSRSLARAISPRVDLARFGVSAAEDETKGLCSPKHSMAARSRQPLVDRVPNTIRHFL